MRVATLNTNPITPNLVEAAGSQADGVFFSCELSHNFVLLTLLIQGWAFQTELTAGVPSSPPVPFLLLPDI